MTKTVDQKILYPKSWYIDNSKSLDGNAKKNLCLEKIIPRNTLEKQTFSIKSTYMDIFWVCDKNIHRGFKYWKENPETVKRAE